MDPLVFLATVFLHERKNMINSFWVHLSQFLSNVIHFPVNDNFMFCSVHMYVYVKASHQPWMLFLRLCLPCFFCERPYHCPELTVLIPSETQGSCLSLSLQCWYYKAYCHACFCCFCLFKHRLWWSNLSSQAHQGKIFTNEAISPSSSFFLIA